MSLLKKIVLGIAIVGSLGAVDTTVVFAKSQASDATIQQPTKVIEKTTIIDKKPTKVIKQESKDSNQSKQKTNKPVNEADAIKKIEKGQREITHVTFKQYKKNLKRAHEVTPERLTELLNSNQTYYLFFGFRSCPYCRNFSKTLAKSMKKNNMRPVYYVNIENFGSKLNPNSPMYKSIQDFISKSIVLDSTPTIAAMKGNKIVGIYRDSQTTLKQLRELNIQLVDTK